MTRSCGLLNGVLENSLNHSRCGFLLQEMCKYIRILKNGFRYGDMAPMAVIELVDRDIKAKGIDSGPVQKKKKIEDDKVTETKDPNNPDAKITSQDVSDQELKEKSWIIEEFDINEFYKASTPIWKQRVMKMDDKRKIWINTPENFNLN